MENAPDFGCEFVTLLERSATCIGVVPRDSEFWASAKKTLKSVARLIESLHNEKRTSAQRRCCYTSFSCHSGLRKVQP